MTYAQTHTFAYRYKLSSNQSLQKVFSHCLKRIFSISILFFVAQNRYLNKPVQIVVPFAEDYNISVAEAICGNTRNGMQSR